MYAHVSQKKGREKNTFRASCGQRVTHIRDHRIAYHDLPATTPYTHTHRLSPYSGHLSHASRTPFSAPGTSCEAHAQSPRNLCGSRAKHAEEPDNRILFTHMHAQLREIRRRRIISYRDFFITPPATRIVRDGNCREFEYHIRRDICACASWPKRKVYYHYTITVAEGHHHHSVWHHFLLTHVHTYSRPEYSIYQADSRPIYQANISAFNLTNYLSHSLAVAPPGALRKGILELC